MEGEKEGRVQDKAEASGVGKSAAVFQEREHGKVSPVERMTIAFVVCEIFWHLPSADSERLVSVIRIQGEESVGRSM